MSEHVRVEIMRRTIEVPVCVNEATTQRIAHGVGERCAEIERTSGRIDTQAFALQVAFAYAAELHTLQQEHDQEQRELAVELDKLLSRLHELASEFAPPA